MGCFSGFVDVRATKMFARLDGVGNQYIVYSVEYSSATETAVIFPVPVAPGDASVQFISLDGYDEFFNDLASGFVAPSTGRWMQDMSEFGDASNTSRVNPRDMFYVASIEELASLREELLIPDDLWDRLPHYRDFGFVVVKLPSTAVTLVGATGAAMSSGPEWGYGSEPDCAGAYGATVVERMALNPIAFRFATREPRCVYFPMIMVSDGEYRPVVEFDHTLYLQHDKLGNEFVQHHIGHVSLRASNFMRPHEASGVICPRSCCFRRILRGQSGNQDLWVYPSNAAARIARWARPRA